MFSFSRLGDERSASILSTSWPSPDLIRGSVPAIPLLGNAKVVPLPGGNGDERLDAVSSTSWPALCRPSRLFDARRSSDRDHRHEAGDDVQEVVRAMICSYFVLDRRGNLGYIIAQPDPTRGALREASQVVGTGTVLPAGHAAGGRRPLAALRWSKSQRLKEPCVTSSSALTFITRQRAGLPDAPPSISPSGSQLTLRAPRCWLFDMEFHPGRSAAEIRDP